MPGMKLITKSVLLILAASSGHYLHAQTYVRDSLRFVDEMKTWESLKNDKEQALLRAQVLMDLADRINRPWFKGRALNRKAYYYNLFGGRDSVIALSNKALGYLTMADSMERSQAFYMLGVATWSDVPTSLNYFLKSYKIDLARRDTFRLAATMGNLAGIYYRAGNMDSAFYFANQFLGAGRALDNPKHIANAYSRLQMLYNEVGSFEQSVEYGLKGLDYSRITGSKSAQRNIYQNLASSYIRLADYDKALFYAKENLSISEGSDMPIGYRTVGNCFAELSRFDSARVYYERGLTAALQNRNEEETFIIYLSLSDIAMGQKELDTALALIRKAQAWYKPYRTSSEAKLMGSLASYYQATGMSDSAAHYGELAFKSARKTESHPYSLSSSQLLFEVYTSIRDYENALKYYLINRKLSDSIASQQTRLMVAEMETRYDNQRKQDEIEQLTNEKRIQDLTLLQQTQLLALGKREAEKKRAELELMAQQAKLTELKAQQLAADIDRQKLLTEKVTADNKLLEKDKDLQDATLSRQRVLRNAALVSSGLLLLVVFLGYARYRARRRYAIALEEKNQLIDAERDKAVQSEFYKTQFLANMSHEIRTPLHAITGMINVLNEKDPREDQQAYLNVMRKSSESLMGVINNVLDISKIEAGKVVIERARFSPGETLQNVINLLHANALSKGLALRSVPRDLPESVIGDQVRLTQVLINLIGNAIKFTEIGSVEVEMTARQEGAEHVMLSCTIRDSGIGIPAERIASIFENFTQAEQGTTRKFGGTGLGLSISRQLIELQGGTISVDSTPGMGSAFMFQIPYESVARPDVIPSHEPERFEWEDLDELDVLIVEDNAYNRMVASETLQLLLKNVRIDMAENGLIALQMIEQNNYDLVFMDVQMPLLDGYATTERIRLELPNEKRGVPVIGVTANATPGDRQRCLDAGMNAYLTKPFHPNDLAGAIAAVGRKQPTAKL